MVLVIVRTKAMSCISRLEDNAHERVNAFQMSCRTASSLEAFGSLNEYRILSPFRNAYLIASPSMREVMLEYHVLHDLTVSDLRHRAILASVDVEPTQTPSVRRFIHTPKTGR